MLVREHLAGAAEAVDHLVDVQQDAVFAADLLDLGQVFVGRDGDADAAHDWLDDDLRDGVGAFADDGGFHVLDAGQVAARVAQAERAAVAGGRRDVQEVAEYGSNFPLRSPMPPASSVASVVPW